MNNTLRFPLRKLAPLMFGTLLLCCGLGVRADDIRDANTLFRQGQYDKALDKVQAVLSAKPKDIQARYLKGLIFIEKGKLDKAIDIFLSLTEDAPDRAEPYNNLGFLYALQGQYDKARMAMEMAIHIQPTYAIAHENLGDIYAKMASKEYERALQLDPANTGPESKLAIVRQLFPKNGSPSRTMALPAPASSPVAVPAKP